MVPGVAMVPPPPQRCPQALARPRRSRCAAKAGLGLTVPRVLALVLVPGAGAFASRGIVVQVLNDDEGPESIDARAAVRGFVSMPPLCRVTLDRYGHPSSELAVPTAPSRGSPRRSCTLLPQLRKSFRIPRCNCGKRSSCNPERERRDSGYCRGTGPRPPTSAGPATPALAKDAGRPRGDSDGDRAKDQFAPCAHLPRPRPEPGPRSGPCNATRVPPVRAPRWHPSPLRTLAPPFCRIDQWQWDGQPRFDQTTVVV
jgi:hypothetical protein